MNRHYIQRLPAVIFVKPPNPIRYPQNPNSTLLTPTPPPLPTYLYLFFHLTLPAHLAQPCTSSLCSKRSTVHHSLANSSLPTTRCTKL